MNQRVKIGAGLALALASGSALGQVSHGVLNVTEVDALDTPASVSVTPTVGFGGWTVDAANSNRGDYRLSFGTANDATSGVLIACAYQTNRNEPSILAGATAYYATSQAYPTGTSFNVDTRLAGNISGTGTDCNYNSTLAYFPIADGWFAASLYNSVNNGVITSAVGNVLLRTEATYTGTGNEFLDPNVASPPAGAYVLSSDTIDFRRDGVLLTTGAKDEDNRASWSTNYVTGEAAIWCQDNGADGGSGENDPVAFAFIPEGTANVTMGTVTATAKKLFKQGNFTVTMEGQPATDGTFRLSIAGESPSTGTLLLAPYVRPERDGATIDNPVWAQPDGTSWVITTRDQPGLTLQDLTSWDVAFSFAFFKNGVAITPGTPSKSYLPRLNEVAAARFAVTEVTPDNGNGDMDCVRSAGNDILDVAGANRGDNQISYLGALLPSIYDNSLDTLAGFMLGSVSQFVRDNSATGGISGWSTLSFDNGDAVSHNASITGGEINSNFALVHFPASRNFTGASDVAAVNGLLNVPITGTAATDGVLMAINWDNNNRAVQVTPNGSSYDLTSYEAQNVTINTIPYVIGQVAVDSVEVGYVYLPYTTPGLIAGQIAADGTVSSSVGAFSIALGTDAGLGFDIFELTIPGVNASTDGILLLNSSSGAHAMSWEPGENGEFEIAGLDLLTQIPGRNAFAFAFIPYTGLGDSLTCPSDLDDGSGTGTPDGGVDINDLLYFLAEFEAGNINADLDDGSGTGTPDGGVDINDLLFFLTRFEAGC